MKLREDYAVRQVAGQEFMVVQGTSFTDMTKVVSLNESGKLLWERLQGRVFQLDDAVAILMQEYDVDEATARHDVQSWIDQLSKSKLIIQ